MADNIKLLWRQVKRKFFSACCRRNGLEKWLREIVKLVWFGSVNSDPSCKANVDSYLTSQQWLCQSQMS